MVYGQGNADLALDQKRNEVKERLARETRIGWPTVTAIAVLMVVGAVIAIYLFLNSGGSR
jgi:hypothetical protein